jgi:hypothetical protein
MKFKILADYDEQSKLQDVLDDIRNTGFARSVEKRNFGKGLNRLAIFLVCQPSYLALKPRIRFSKSDLALYMDIMLDLEAMKAANRSTRQKLVATALAAGVPAVLAHYEIENFAKADFEKYFLEWITGLGWLPGDGIAPHSTRP